MNCTNNRCKGKTFISFHIFALSATLCLMLSSCGSKDVKTPRQENNHSCDSSVVKLDSVSKNTLDSLLVRVYEFYFENRFKSSNLNRQFDQANYFIDTVVRVFENQAGKPDSPTDTETQREKIWQEFSGQGWTNNVTTYAMMQEASYHNACVYVSYLVTLKQLLEACEDDNSHNLLLKEVELQKCVMEKLTSVISTISGSEWTDHLTMKDIYDISSFGKAWTASNQLFLNDFNLLKKDKFVDYVRPLPAKRFLLDCIKTEIDSHKDYEYYDEHERANMLKAVNSAQQQVKDLDKIIDEWLSVRSQWIEEVTHDYQRRAYYGNGAQFLIELAGAVSPEM